MHARMYVRIYMKINFKKCVDHDIYILNSNRMNMVLNML
jgi:hypothetical protein